jgi:alpha-beta hydrolase superfamily lysophospholipase
MVRARAASRLAAQGLLGLALILLAACVPTVQQAQPHNFAGAPHFNLAAERFVSFDGAELGLTSWLPPDGAQPEAVIIGLHGMNDYANTFYLAGPWFAGRGVALYAYDARGFGRSPNRGVWPGERLMSEDLRTAVRIVRNMHPDTPIIVVGDSMGAASAIATFGSDDAPRIDRLVLVAPAVWGWSTLPDHYALTLWIGAHTFPWRAVQPPSRVTRRITASDNQEALLQAGRAPHMIWTTRIDAVYGLVNLMETAAGRSADLDGQVLFLYGAHDQIIPRNSAIAAARRLPTSVRTAYYENGWHWLLRDLQREVVYEDILAFIRDPEAPLPSDAPPLLPVVQANR